MSMVIFFMKQINAGEFKAKCLALMQEVATTGEPLQVMKHGKHFVMVQPAVPEKPKTLYGIHKGLIKIHGDLDDPYDAGWDEMLEDFDDDDPA